MHTHIYCLNLCVSYFSPIITAGVIKLMCAFYTHIQIDVYLFEVVGVRSRTNKRTVAWTNKRKEKEKTKESENARKSSFNERRAKNSSSSSSRIIRNRGKKARQTFFMGNTHMLVVIIVQANCDHKNEYTHSAYPPYCLIFIRYLR